MLLPRCGARRGGRSSQALRGDGQPGRRQLRGAAEAAQERCARPARRQSGDVRAASCARGGGARASVATSAHRAGGLFGADADGGNLERALHGETQKAPQVKSVQLPATLALRGERCARALFWRMGLVRTPLMARAAQRHPPPPRSSLSVGRMQAAQASARRARCVGLLAAPAVSTLKDINVRRDICTFDAPGNAAYVCVAAP